MSNAIRGHEFARRSQNGPDGTAEREPAPQDEPIRSYFALAGLFLGATTTALYALRRHRRPFPDPGPLDLLLLGLGTARLSRLITRDKVMRPLRAPFTAAKTVAPGQVREQVKGGGLVRAVGEPALHGDVGRQCAIVDLHRVAGGGPVWGNGAVERAHLGCSQSKRCATRPRQEVTSSGAGS